MQASDANEEVTNTSFNIRGNNRERQHNDRTKTRKDNRIQSVNLKLPICRNELEG